MQLFGHLLLQENVALVLVCCVCEDVMTTQSSSNHSVHNNQLNADFCKMRTTIDIFMPTKHTFLCVKCCTYGGTLNVAQTVHTANRHVYM